MENGELTNGSWGKYAYHVIETLDAHASALKQINEASVEIKVELAIIKTKVTLYAIFGAAVTSLLMRYVFHI
jgi:hypothetical protein